MLDSRYFCDKECMKKLILVLILCISNTAFCMKVKDAIKSRLNFLQEKVFITIIGGVDAVHHGDPALITSIMFGHEKQALMLIKRGADLDKQGYGPDNIHGGITALTCAIFENNISIARLLGELGADLDTEHARGLPFHIALDHGNKEMVKTLIKHNAQVHKDIKGEKAYNITKERCDLELVKWLKPYLYNPDTQNDGKIKKSRRVRLKKKKEKSNKQK